MKVLSVFNSIFATRCFLTFQCVNGLSDYDSPMEITKRDEWSQHNRILYILSGKKTYHTPEGRSWIVESGNAAFVKQGAGIIEKFFDEVFCIMTFFIPDSYLRSFIQENSSLVRQNRLVDKENDSLVALDVNAMTKAYFESLIPYFFAETKPSEELLELKFKELLLNILTNSINGKLNGYIKQLSMSQEDNLRRVMEANFLFNLTLDDYAKLNNFSLSSFKRHFYTAYKIRPGQWLLKKKLEYAHKLLLSSDMPITDIAFESGFEDSTHFSHVFKKHFGKPPMKFRAHFNTVASACA